MYRSASIVSRRRYRTKLDAVLAKSNDIDVDRKRLEVIISTGDECRIPLVGECNAMSVRE